MRALKKQKIKSTGYLKNRIVLILWENRKLSPFRGKAVEEESTTDFYSTSLYALL